MRSQRHLTTRVRSELDLRSLLLPNPQGFHGWKKIARSKGRKRSEYVLRLFSEMVSNSCEEKGKNVPGPLSGSVEGKIGSKKISVVTSGIMEGSEM